MITKFHTLIVQEENQGRMYTQHIHQYGCLRCRSADSGYIGQVDELALPYLVHEQEVEDVSE